MSVILDLFARKPIGYSTLFHATFDNGLYLAVLTMAIARRNHPNGVIHRSDLGRTINNNLLCIVSK
jgi:transposase InsO family protein